MSITITSDVIDEVVSRADNDRNSVMVTHAFKESDPIGLFQGVVPASELPRLVSSLRAGEVTVGERVVSLGRGDDREQLIVVQDSAIPTDRLRPLDCPVIDWYLQTTGSSPLPRALEQFLHNASIDWWTVATAWFGYSCSPGRSVSVDMFVPVPVRLSPPTSTENRIELTISTDPQLLSQLHFTIRTRRTDRVVQSFLPPVDEFTNSGEERGLPVFQWTKLLDNPLEPNDVVRVEIKTEGDVITLSQWSQFSTVKQHLEMIATSLRRGDPTQQTTVRSLLQWFGAQRRGSWIVKDVRRALGRAGLRTEPDFESAWLDGQISFVLRGASSKDVTHSVEPQQSSPENPASPVSVPSPSAIGVEQDSLPTPPPAGNESSPPNESTQVWGVTPSATPLLSAENAVDENGGSEHPAVPADGADDPTHRISKLAGANRPPVSVKPDSALSEAVTVMLENDFSQLPVMPNERDVKGVVTWQSIGSRLALGRGATTVREVMDMSAETTIVGLGESIFSVIPKLVEHGYVLVRGTANRIVGIVTASDLSLKFKELSEPFLLLSEIENRVRNLISLHFAPSELSCVKDPNDEDRTIDSVYDMTFGEYVRLLEDPERWNKLATRLDRRSFVKSLGNVGRIRNDVMHFDPDGILPEKLTALRNFALFLRRLDSIEVVQTSQRASPSGT